jgi:hypothetical protein
VSFDSARRIVDAATAGPWQWHAYRTDGAMTLAHPIPNFHEMNVLKTTDDWPPNQPDADFIVMARNAFPAMLDAIEAAQKVAGPGFDIADNLRLQQSLDRVRELLQQAT